MGLEGRTSGEKPTKFEKGKEFIQFTVMEQGQFPSCDKSDVYHGDSVIEKTHDGYAGVRN